MHELNVTAADLCGAEKSNLTTLSLEELKALKKRWWQYGVDSGAIAACGLIARFLGKKLDAKYGPKYRFEAGQLSIYLDDYGHYMTVMHAGRAVVGTHHNSQVFIPGDWTAELVELEARAAAVWDGNLHQVDEAKRQELLIELGLAEAKPSSKAAEGLSHLQESFHKCDAPGGDR